MGIGIVSIFAENSSAAKRATSKKDIVFPVPTFQIPDLGI
jgi:hypothetical protein